MPLMPLVVVLLFFPLALAIPAAAPFTPPARFGAGLPSPPGWPVPPVLYPPDRLMPLALKLSRFWMSRVVRLLVSKLFLPSSTAFCVLLIAPPTRSVLPLTLTSNPPSPAWMPLRSLTLA